MASWDKHVLSAVMSCTATLERHVYIIKELSKLYPHFYVNPIRETIPNST